MVLVTRALSFLHMKVGTMLGCMCSAFDYVPYIRLRNMPDVEDLMQEWPAQFEEALQEV